MDGHLHAGMGEDDVDTMLPDWLQDMLQIGGTETATSVEQGPSGSSGEDADESFTSQMGTAHAARGDSVRSSDPCMLGTCGLPLLQKDEEVANQDREGDDDNEGSQRQVASRSASVSSAAVPGGLLPLASSRGPDTPRGKDGLKKQTSSADAGDVRCVQ